MPELTHTVVRHDKTPCGNDEPEIRKPELDDCDQKGSESVSDGAVEEAVPKSQPDFSDTSPDDPSSPDTQTQAMIKSQTSGREFLKAQRVESLMSQQFKDEIYSWGMPPQSPDENTCNDDDSFGPGNYVDDEESFGSDN